jgi:hypothetical protein
MWREQSPAMRFVRTIRGLRASLLALFVVAQVVGVTHLLYDHTLNVYETTPVGAHKHAYVKPTATSPDADHHHGVLDLHDQRCALHTLAAPLPEVSGVSLVDFVSVPVFAVESTTVTGGDPGVLDRPPKPLSLS